MLPAALILLTYTVDLQNTGNYPATTVEIRDTLDMRHCWYSLYGQWFSPPLPGNK